MPEISILLPHKHDPENDKSLAVALSCIAANTWCDYELIIDSTTPADPYVVVNDMARRAKSEYIFLTNSDIYVGPGWDKPLRDLARPDTIVNATLIESGAIAVFHGNLEYNFGMTPETFRRADFEAQCMAGWPVPPGDGFVYYALMHRQTFIDRGCFDLSRGPYPEPVDSFYWDVWRAEGRPIVRAASYIYHLQRYSHKDEQEKAVRHGR